MALSPSVTLGNNVLFEIPYPDFVIKFWSMFKMTGRFIWIVNYAILSIVLIYFIKSFRKKSCFIILILCLSVQLIDFKALIEYKKNIKEKITPKESKYDNPLWNKLYEENNIKHIYYDKNIFKELNLPMFGILYSDITIWARDKDIKFNAFYFARPVGGIKEAYLDKIQEPKEEDIFIFMKDNFDHDAILSTTLKHFYIYDNLIIARSSKIKGWEDIEVAREEILTQNIAKY